MKGRKYLIGGIIFLALQLFTIIVLGFPKTESNAYGVGYLVGYCAMGIIGICFLVAYFVNKAKKI